MDVIEVLAIAQFIKETGVVRFVNMGIINHMVNAGNASI
jgi:hypothetical protein